jgi:hypothetical protein
MLKPYDLHQVVDNRFSRVAIKINLISSSLPSSSLYTASNFLSNAQDQL